MDADQLRRMAGITTSRPQGLNEDHDRLRRMAGITTLQEGGDYELSQFDTQVHPEEDPEMDRYEAQQEYSNVRQEATEGIQEVVERVAKQYGWQAIDVLKLAAEDLEGFYNMDRGAS